VAVVFNALFGSNQSKTAGTSLNINPTDITVAAGDDIFLAYAGDDVGSAFGVTDGGTASITWTLEKEQINAGNVKSQLWRGNVTAGGTLTDITISWTTNVTAKAAVAGWFSGVGTQDGTDGNSTSGGVAVVDHDRLAFQNGDLVIGAGGHEGPGTDALGVTEGGEWTALAEEVGQDGTTGGGVASNIVVNLVYGIANADSVTGDFLLSNNSTAVRDSAGAGAVYSPAAVAFVPRQPAINHAATALLMQGWRRSLSGLWRRPEIWLPDGALAA